MAPREGRTAAVEAGGDEVVTLPLPPGQRRIDGFPRFGTHLSRPAPAVAADPVIAVSGAVMGPVDVRLATLATLPRRALRADFHCVAGWSATDLHWEGVPFGAFYRAIVEPALVPGAGITHVVFGGLDGFRSVVWLEDALAESVLLADRLEGRCSTARTGPRCAWSAPPSTAT